MDEMQEKPEICNIVGKAILAHATSATLPRGTTEQEVKMAVREVMRDNPGFFYFSHQWTFEENTGQMHLRYKHNKTAVEPSIHRRGRPL